MGYLKGNIGKGQLEFYLMIISNFFSFICRHLFYYALLIQKQIFYQTVLKIGE